jgi:hypothetical protein
MAIKIPTKPATASSHSMLRKSAPLPADSSLRGKELTKDDWALLDSVSTGDLQGVYSALWAGANPNCKKPVYETSPLVIACRAGYSYLIINFVDINQSLLSS